MGHMKPFSLYDFPNRAMPRRIDLLMQIKERLSIAVLVSAISHEIHSSPVSRAFGNEWKENIYSRLAKGVCGDES